MTEITPLYGCFGSDPLAYLLKVNDTTVLLDCGWNTDFDLSLLEPLRAVAADVDVVLISHPDMEHCGALPYAMANLGLDGARVYMTKACEDVAKVTLRDAYRARRARCTDEDDGNQEDAGVRSIVRRKDVEECFMRVTGVEFGAPEVINPTEGGEEESGVADAESSYEKLVVKAIYAGRLLGGAVWVINTEVEEIVYAVDFASTSAFEQVVPGIDWHKVAQPKPRLLITDAYHTPFTPIEACTPRAPVAKLKQRRSALQDEIRDALRGGGNVLMPVDTSGRILELVMLMEAFWQSDPELARAHPIFLVGREVAAVLELAANNVVSMKRRNRERDGNSSSAANAFADLRHFPRSRCLTTLDALVQHPDFSDGQTDSSHQHHHKPTIVVLATDNSLDGVSVSRGLFERWRSGSRNLILCTSEPKPGTIAHQLLADRPRSPGGGDAQLARSVSYTHYHSEVLAGEELEDYRTRMAEEEQRRKEEAAAAAAAAVAAAQEAAARDDALLGGSDDDDDFEDEEFGTTGGFVGAAGGRSLGGTGAGGRRGNGQVQRQQFDFKPVMRRMGEYGQPIKLGDFGLTTVYDPTNPEFTMRERMEDELNRGADVEEEYDTDDDEVVALMDEETRQKKGKWPPKKVVAESVFDVMVLCRVLYVDMTGHADNLAHQKLVELAAPQRMIVVHGGQAETEAFARVCRVRDLCKEICLPSAGETTVFANSKSFKVALSKELLAAMPPFRAVGEEAAVEVTSVAGVLRRRNNHFVLEPMPLETLDDSSSSEGEDEGDEDENDAASGGGSAAKVGGNVAGAESTSDGGADAEDVADEPPAVKRQRSLYVRDRGTALNLQRISELLHQKLPTLRTRKGTGTIDCGYGLHVACNGGNITLTGPLSEQYFQVQEVVYGMHQLV